MFVEKFRKNIVKYNDLYYLQDIKDRKSSQSFFFYHKDGHIIHGILDNIMFGADITVKIKMHNYDHILLLKFVKKMESLYDIILDHKNQTLKILPKEIWDFIQKYL
jgi:hypothetical protein